MTQNQPLPGLKVVGIVDEDAFRELPLNRVDKVCSREMETLRTNP